MDEKLLARVASPHAYQFWGEEDADDVPSPLIMSSVSRFCLEVWQTVVDPEELAEVLGLFLVKEGEASVV